MSRALIICPEPVRRVTAGVGSRMAALARVLADAGHAVTLAMPNDPAEAELGDGRIRTVRGEPDRLGALAEGHDWVLLHGHVGNHYLSQRDDLPVVVDLYDPFLIENLHYHRELGFEPYRTDHATWRLQMSRGDLFLCSSEEQRFYYLGWLTALGRVNPLATDEDPSLRRLIVELPFGTPDGVPPQPLPRRESWRALPRTRRFSTSAASTTGTNIDPENSASLSLFLRVGFQREGLLRGNWRTHLGIRDSVIMGKLRDD